MCPQMTPPSVTQEQYLGGWQGSELYEAGSKANLVAVRVMDVTACSMGLVPRLLAKSRPLLEVA